MSSRFMCALLLLAGCEGAPDDLTDLKTPDARIDDVGKADGAVCDYDWSWLDRPCPKDWIGTGDGCDCGCDVEDPDCAAEEPVVTDDPHDPNSCQGPLLSNAEIAALFASGEVERVLGDTIVRWESRRCNELTGCTAWESQGSSFAGVQWAGQVELSANDTEFGMEFHGSTWSSPTTTVGRCTVANGGITCQPQNYLGTQDISVTGEMRDGCVRVSGHAEYRNALTGEPTGDEYRVAMLARFEPPPEDPPPPPPDPTDPMNPASCEGPLLDQAGVAALFEPGALEARLGETRAHWESRECNALTGCTEWTSQGSNLSGVDWAGTAELEVVQNAFRLRLEGARSGGGTSTVGSCTVSGGLLGCAPVNYLGTQYITTTGEIRNGCLRVFGEHEYLNPLTHEPSGAQYRVAVVAEF